MTRLRHSVFGLFALLLCACAVRNGNAQQTVEGPRLKLNVLEIAIHGRVHTQFNTTTVDDEQPTEWLLRRVRLEASVQVNELVSGKIQPDFAGDRVSVKEAYLKLNFSPGVQLLAGKAFRPFSLLEQTSSNRILPIERGLDIRGVSGFDEYAIIHDLKYSDREIGLQLMGAPSGAPLGLAYAAGVFRGPLSGRVGGQETNQIAARVTVEPLEDLRLGAGWSNRHFVDAARSLPVGDPVLERGNAWEVDVEFGSFSPGLHLLSEVAFGDFDPAAAVDFVGAHAWLGYRTAAISPRVSAVEPILRLSYGNVDTEPLELGGTLITPGINVFFGPLNRVMLNYDIWSPAGDAGTEGSFKALFQLAF